MMYRILHDIMETTHLLHCIPIGYKEKGKIGDGLNEEN